MNAVVPHETLGEIPGLNANCAGFSRELFRGLLEVTDVDALRICAGCLGRIKTGVCPEGLKLPLEVTDVLKKD